MATVAITKDQEMAEGLRQHHEDMRRMPDEVKALLRQGFHVANWDEAKENWIVTHISTGELIAKVRAL